MEPGDLYEVNAPERPGCAFCLQPVELGARTACPQCRSLYHPDCWTANDRRCAVYGCGSVPVPKPAPAAPAHVHGAPRPRIPWAVVVVGLVVLTNIFRAWVSRPEPRPPLPRPGISESASPPRVRDLELQEAQEIVEQSRLSVKALEQRLTRPVHRDDREHVRRELDSAVYDLVRAREIYLKHGSFLPDSPHRSAVGSLTQTIERLREHSARLARP